MRAFSRHCVSFVGLTWHVHAFSGAVLDRQPVHAQVRLSCSDVLSDGVSALVRTKQLGYRSKAWLLVSNSGHFSALLEFFA